MHCITIHSLRHRHKNSLFLGFRTESEATLYHPQHSTLAVPPVLSRVSRNDSMRSLGKERERERERERENIK